MKEYKHQKNCNYCKFITERSQLIIEEDEVFLAIVSFFQYSDGHLLVITKDHVVDISELTKEEWKNLLPILKKLINKIGNAFQPKGFSIVTRKGKIAGQNIFHFHLHIIPEYNSNYNYLKSYTAMNKISSQEHEEVKGVLKPDIQGVIEENDKAMVSLVTKTQSEGVPHVVVTSKNSFASVNEIDVETWEVMGGLMQENIRKIENKIFSETPPSNKGLRFLISLGEGGGIQLKSHDKVKLQIHIAQTFERGDNLSLKGANDIRRTIEKLKIVDNVSQPSNFQQMAEETNTSQLEQEITAGEKIREGLKMIGSGIYQCLIEKITPRNK